MNKLTLEHLAPYLPYGLKFILESDKTEDFEEEIFYNSEKFKKGAVWELIGLNNSKELNIPLGDGYLDGFLLKNETTYVNFKYGIKPILRPLSDLTKKIEINGEKFVPIEYIEKWNTSIDFAKELYALQEDIRCLSTTSYVVYQQLIEWHFDVFDLRKKNLCIYYDELK